MTTERQALVPLRPFKVGVFPRAGKRPGILLYNAYTTWYNPEWSGCCEHMVNAISGTEAKRAAIAEHKARCISRTTVVHD